MRRDDAVAGVEEHAERRAGGPAERRPRHAQRFRLHDLRLADVVHDVEVERDGQRRGAHHARQHAEHLAGKRVEHEEGRADGQRDHAGGVDPAAREARDQHRHEQRDRQAEQRDDGVEDGDALLAPEDVVGLDRDDRGDRGAREGFEAVKRGKGARAGGPDGEEPDGMPDLGGHGTRGGCCGPESYRRPRREIAGKRRQRGAKRGWLSFGRVWTKSRRRAPLLPPAAPSC